MRHNLSPQNFIMHFNRSKGLAMYNIEKRVSLNGLWSVHTSANSERVAIQRADLLKQQQPSMLVRVVDERGNLIYQA